MGRRSSSSFLPGKLERTNILLALCACLLLAGCASRPADETVYERWPTSGANATVPYLLALREYLALPAAEQAERRDRMQQAVSRGGRSAELEYALALSVDREDRASLEHARAHFEKLLAAPDPLPVALDALVRLQLGQVIDRIERMQESGEIHRAYRAAARESRTCRIELDDLGKEFKQTHDALLETRRKLDALAQIEQAVSDQDPPEEQEPRSQ